PAKIKPNQVYYAPVISLDIFSTVAANLGRPAKVKNKLDGIDLVPVVTHPEKPAPDRTRFWRMYDRDLYVARNSNGAFKVLTKPNGNELYNLDDDVSEKNNLLKSGKNKEAYDTLVKELEAWKKEMAKEPAFLGLGQTKEYWEIQRQKKQNNK